MERKIDIVLPVRSTVFGRTGELERVRRGLFPSLCHFGFPGITNRVHIVCPRRDLPEITGNVLRQFPQFDYSVSADEELAEEIGYNQVEFDRVPGWFKQQLIKLALVARVETEIALVLDADVIASKKIAAADIQLERLPYQVGASEFRGWFEASAAALGIDLTELETFDLAHPMAVTPEFLSRAVVSALLAHLRQRAGGSQWGPYLMQFSQDYDHTWTEFTLYWVWYASRKSAFAAKHVARQLYLFFDDSRRVRSDVIPTQNALFIVLQATKLNVEACEPIYAAITSRLDNTADSTAIARPTTMGRWKDPNSIISFSGPQLAIRTTYEQRYLSAAIRKSIESGASRELGIEFGAGYGRLTPILETFFDKVIGFEREISLIRVADTFSRTIDLQQIESLAHVPVADGIASFSFTCTVLQHMVDDDVFDTVAEMKRVTRGGFILLIENTTEGFLYGPYDRARVFTKGRPINEYVGIMAPWRLNFVRPRYFGSHGAIAGHLMMFSDPTVPSPETPDISDWAQRELRYP